MQARPLQRLWPFRGHPPGCRTFRLLLRCVCVVAQLLTLQPASLLRVPELSGSSGALGEVLAPGAPRLLGAPPPRRRSMFAG